MGFIDEIRVIAGEGRVLVDEPMRLHTTFKIGGCADYFVSPGSIDEIRALIKCAEKNNIRYYVIGNGSNLLVNDGGYRGMIIHLGDDFSEAEYYEDGTVTVRAGARLAALGADAAQRGLAGFEFAAGIPGTVGGAVIMNAGAYGREISDIIVSADLLMPDGQVRSMSKDELQLGYRTSIAARKGYIVLAARFALYSDDVKNIRTRMQELAARRISRQPLEYPSAGSTFKRPEGYFAGKLIADAGLKGLRVGGAKVSEKHAGFIINTGNATARDVIELTDLIKKRVMEMYGVELELEVKII